MGGGDGGGGDGGGSVLFVRTTLDMGDNINKGAKKSVQQPKFVHNFPNTGQIFSNY